MQTQQQNIMMAPASYVPRTDGTTILAMKYDNGVICASDSRVCRGVVIEDRGARKIRYIDDKIIFLSAGTSAHNLYVAKTAKNYLLGYKTENGELGVRPSAHLVSVIGYHNRNVLNSSLIVAGHDSKDGFNIVAIPQGGAKIENLNFYVTGSGGDLANSYVTANWTPNLTYEQAKKIATAGNTFYSNSVPNFGLPILLFITKSKKRLQWP